MKKWNVLSRSDPSAPLGAGKREEEDILKILLNNRDIKTKTEIKNFLHPPDPFSLTFKDVDIDEKEFKKAIKRIQRAIASKESIIVYADYDADGVTAGAIMWETIHVLGGNVMPYIPHRVAEGYGLSVKGIDAVHEQYNPTLIITVDHGITAREKVAYAKKLGIDVIVTDHHVKPEKCPDCTIVHTTKLSGSGVSWFLSKELLSSIKHEPSILNLSELLALATIGTIADMVPLVGPNRSIAKYGLHVINETKRVGLNALITDAGLIKGSLGTYDVSHVIAPRLNAMGRIEHALDALRLLCTKQDEKAMVLAKKIGLTNKERQQLMTDTTAHALQGLTLQLQGQTIQRKLIFIAHETYNQGVIGLVAGKLVEEYYRPAIVIAKGETVSKASARSIAGFNIVEAIRTCSDILVDVGGHPMAAGFTVETKHLAALQKRLEALAQKELDDEKLTRTLRIDTEIPLESVTFELWEKLSGFEPFGFGNLEPVFVSKGVTVVDLRTVGNGNKHLKLRLQPTTYLPRRPASPNRGEQAGNLQPLDAIAFGMGDYAAKLDNGNLIDVAYSISLDTWNGNRRLQLKVKDIHFD